MSIIIIFYIVGCLLSYMRVNSSETYWEERGVARDPMFVACYTATSWIGFLVSSFLFIMGEREKGERFFRL